MADIKLKVLHKRSLNIAQTLVCIALIILAYVLLVLNSIIQGELTDIHEIFSLGFQAFIHQYFIAYYVTYILLFYERYYKIGILADELQEIKTNDVIDKSKNILRTVSETYEYLHYSCKYLNTICNVPLFSIIIFNLTDILLIVYYILIKHDVDGNKEIVTLFIYILQIIIIVIPTVSVQTQVLINAFFEL